MLSLLAAVALAPSTLLVGGAVVDGTGGIPRHVDVRIVGQRVAAVGRLTPRPGERVLRVDGLVVAPGFIDAHSHADVGIAREPTAISQVTQGITTAVVGQDGGWSRPVGDLLAGLEALRPALNFAAFSGHGGLRARAMGEDFKRPATPAEIATMRDLLDADMAAGALGLSSGLEYDPGYYSNRAELAALAASAARAGGLYISHVRDEANAAFEAFEELASIARDASLPAQISHIKLGSSKVWGRADDVCDRFLRPYASPKITADVYPYVFWQSTMAALTPSREWEKREIWEGALADVGGPQNVRLTAYTHEAKWVGKTVAEIAESTGRDTITIIQEILRKTRGPGGSGEESVAVTAMNEADLETFLRHPRVMLSSDGLIGGTHPRGAGAFPRVLGRYVRERGVIPLPEAVRKMTALPAEVFGLEGRGVLRPGAYADVVVFDPKTIADHATAEAPMSLSVGVRFVWVNGVPVLRDGRATGLRGGRALRRSPQSAFSKAWDPRRGPVDEPPSLRGG